MSETSLWKQGVIFRHDMLNAVISLPIRVVSTSSAKRGWSNRKVTIMGKHAKSDYLAAEFAAIQVSIRDSANTPEETNTANLWFMDAAYFDDKCYTLANI